MVYFYFKFRIYLGFFRVGEDFGFFLFKFFIYFGSGINIRFIDELFIFRFFVNYLFVCVNGIVLGWVGDEGRCGGGEILFIFVLVFFILEGNLLLLVFLIIFGVF